MNLKVCVLQPKITFWSCNDNLTRIQKMIDSINEEIELFVLPETFNTGFHPKAHLVAEQHENSQTLQWMKINAEKRNCAITGSVTIKEGEETYNRLYFVYPNQEVVWYDKKHLYKMGGEHHEFSSGDKKVIVEYKGWKIQLAVCYDLRFPVWLRNTDSDPFDILVIVGCWSILNRKHWKTLTKARAIENQSFVLAANNCGTLPDAQEDDKDAHYIGESAIIDSYGNYIVKGNCGVQDQLIAHLDKKSQCVLRESFPVLNDSDLFEFKN